MAAITETQRRQVRESVRGLHSGSLEVVDVDVQDDNDLQGSAALVTVKLSAANGDFRASDFSEIRHAARAKAWLALGEDREVRVVYVSDSDEVAMPEEDSNRAPGDKRAEEHTG